MLRRIACEPLVILLLMGPFMAVPYNVTASRHAAMYGGRKKEGSANDLLNYPYSFSGIEILAIRSSMESSPISRSLRWDGENWAPILIGGSGYGEQEHDCDKGALGEPVIVDDPESGARRTARRRRSRPAFPDRYGPAA